MKTKEEIKEWLDGRIADKDEALRDLNRDLKDVQSKLNDISESKCMQEYQAARKVLYDELNDQDKALMKDRERLTKKKGRAKWLGLLFLALHLVVSIRVMKMLDFEFSMPEIAVYGIVILVAILVYAIPVGIRKAILNMKINGINKEQGIAEYNKKNTVAFTEYQNNVKAIQTTINKYRQEETKISEKINQIEEEKMKYLFTLKELDFNCEFADSILFYGKEKRNHYDIYIDGRLYDTVRGHQITRIRLTPGLHSVKFENTAYNIVDKSVDYSYSFNTIQLEVGEFPRAYAYVIEYKTIKSVSGEEFQNITKTKLI